MDFGWLHVWKVILPLGACRTNTRYTCMSHSCHRPVPAMTSHWVDEDNHEVYKKDIDFDDHDVIDVDESQDVYDNNQKVDDRTRNVDHHDNDHDLDHDH